MVKEQRLDANLEDIHKGIEAADVRQFVGDHRLQLFFREAGKRGCGQEDDRSKPSDDCRRLQPLALAELNGAADTEPVLKDEADLEYSWAHDTGFPAAFTLQQEESAGGSKAEQSDAQKPRFDQPRQSIE